MTLFNFYCIQPAHFERPLFNFEYCPVRMVKQNLQIVVAARTPAILKGLHGEGCPDQKTINIMTYCMFVHNFCGHQEASP